MKYFGKSKANLYTLLAAVAITLGVRHFVFTPDSNLLIVSVTFVLAYTAIYIIVFLSKHLSRQ